MEPFLSFQEKEKIFIRKAGAFPTKKCYFFVFISYSECPHRGWREVERRFSHGPETMRWEHQRAPWWFICLSGDELWDVKNCFKNPNEADHRIVVGKQWIWKKSMSEMIYSLRQIRSYTLQRVLPTKGKRKGKARELTMCKCRVRIWVYKEEYDIILVF